MEEILSRKACVCETEPERTGAYVVFIKQRKRDGRVGGSPVRDVSHRQLCGCCHHIKEQRSVYVMHD